MAIDGQFGGRVTFEFAGVRIPPSEADVILDISPLEVDGMANQDGSDAYKQKPKQVGAEIKLRNKLGVDFNALLLQRGNCTITETDNGRTHLFTNTRLVGAVKINVSSGEVDGLKIAGGTYTPVNS